jgi:hypothetical protein
MEALKTKLADMSRYTKPTTKANSNRAHLIEQFLERLNPGRKQAGYPELTPARLGKMVAHLSDDDLYFTFNTCSKYNGPFSKCFFGSLKVKK